MNSFEVIYKQICHDPMNSEWQEKGHAPLYTADARAKIVIVGQAPGARAQESMIPWNDASGETLRTWLGMSPEVFYDPSIVSLLPMDFYYPGKGVHGDLPPRRGFAETWHPRILEHMPEVELTILIGAYAQKHYLGKTAQKNLTETVRHYEMYAPDYFPLVHPSPLNFRWQTKNPWFKTEIIPALQQRVKEILS